jgi:DeoR/GlpR family transcriptional regulator of sugar metabolism
MLRKSERIHLDNRIIKLVSTSGPYSTKELADHFRIPPATMIQKLDRLARSGHLSKYKKGIAAYWRANDGYGFIRRQE